MKHLILIVIVVALSIIANLPSQFHLFGQKYYRPSLDLFVLGRRFYRDLNIKLGLDLQGGTHLVYEPSRKYSRRS
jgi:preprotein translocase subunit SecD